MINSHADFATADAGIGDLIGQLREDGSRYAHAELAFRKEQLSLKVAEVKQVAIFGGAAAVLALAALITLLVGLVLSLAPAIGMIWATLIVVGVTLVVAFLLVKAAQSHAAKIGTAS